MLQVHIFTLYFKKLHGYRQNIEWREIWQDQYRKSTSEFPNTNGRTTFIDKDDKKLSEETY